MWRNLVSCRNRLSINQTAQCLNGRTALSFSFSPISQNQTAPYSAQCAEDRKVQEESELPMALREAIAKQTDVSLSIAKHLLLKETNKNVVVSPLSIQAALSLIAAGSKGSTLSQLLSFLKADSVDDLTSLATQFSDIVFAGGGPYLSFANGLWSDKSLILKPSFKQIFDSHYMASLTQGDFRNKAAQVGQQINSWMEKNTNGLFKDVVQEGSPGRLDRLVLGNALYFKGTWMYKFLSSKTKNYEFCYQFGPGYDGKSVIAPCMTTSGSRKKYLFKVFDDFQVLGLPYDVENRCFTLYTFHPKTKDALTWLVDKVFSQSSSLEEHLPKIQIGVADFKIPKFKVSYEMMASDLLKELGLTLPFLEGELTEMADSVDGETLSVSNIFQKASIEVNEEATKAATTTAAITGIMSCQPPPAVDIVVDHPFLFLIRENATGAVLFVGQVLNPLVH